jgi:hypothetical protein
LRGIVVTTLWRTLRPNGVLPRTRTVPVDVEGVGSRMQTEIVLVRHALSVVLFADSPPRMSESGS